MVKTAEEWNKLFFEERMSYLDYEPDTAAPTEPSYRRVMSNMVVSNEDPPRLYTITDPDHVRLDQEQKVGLDDYSPFRDRSFYWKQFNKLRKVDVTDQFEQSYVYDLYIEAFPLEGEERDPSN